MRLALAISIFFALLYAVWGQPPMPIVEDDGENATPEPLQTFTAIAAWTNQATNATGLRLTVSNASIFYVAHLPATATNHAVQLVLGTNWLTLSATNANGSGDAVLTTTGNVTNWCEFICYGRNNASDPWRRINPSPQIMDKPMLLAMTEIRNWITTNWTEVPN